MKRLLLFTICCWLWASSAIGQELFIHNKPASVLPGGSWVLQSVSHFYKEDGFLRNYEGLSVGHGINRFWELTLSAGISNHNHPVLVSELFREEDPNHDHNGHNHGTTGTDGAPNLEHNHPYRFTGLRLYSQFKFLNIDGPNRHFRMAAYQVISGNRTTHNFAEPNLMHRNAGLGAGFIATGLWKRTAVSLRSGFVMPFGFKEKNSNRYFRSGNALDYALSVGYLVYPKKYTNYKQLNINFYLEFMGKIHGEARIKEGNRLYYSGNYPELRKGSYLEARPGIQFILQSRVRLGLSSALPLLGRTETMEYPQFQVNALWLILK